MVQGSSPAKLRPWSKLTAKMVVGVVPALVSFTKGRFVLTEDPRTLHYKTPCTFYHNIALRKAILDPS